LHQIGHPTKNILKIEVSPDTGHTWVNVLTQDTTYSMSYGVNSKPALRGSTNGWQIFRLDMENWASNWNGPISYYNDC